MSRVLITGGTGVLGRELVPRLAAAGHGVRVMSRRAAPAEGAPAEWAQAQIGTGEGLAEAVAGVAVIVHAASSPFRRTREVDVEGTRRLLEAAKAAGVSHFVYISIVGIDRIPLPYYKHKLAAEKLIEESGVPYSVLRAPQFFTLMDEILGNLLRFPVGVYPAGFKFQPIDPGEVAERIVQQAEAGPGGRLPEIAGPEVRSAVELARVWLKARGKRRLLVPLPLFGKVAGAYRAGYNCAPESKYGRITWAEWLSRRYG
ncbi:MAG: NAD(P)H-binding protein [Dehalococcoidia bacterium]|nr:NAD(P)H-binding protein [Dehalococcoidia bacterium]